MRHIGLNFTPSKVVLAVDMSIAGDVTRTVLEGCPDLGAKNAMEALQELRAEHEDFRRFVIEPPRGHSGINATLLLPPFSSEADRVAVVAEQFGYVPVAGTLLMTAAAALVDTARVQVHEPETIVILDTAHSRTEVVVAVQGGRSTSARWATGRPKIVGSSQSLSLETGHTFPVTVISPGLPYVVARAADVGVGFQDVEALSDAGAMLSHAAGRQLPLKEMGMEQDADAYLVMLVGKVADDGSGDAAQVPAAWVGPDGDVSHSPTGTGALAVAAFCVEAGELPIGRPLDVRTPSSHTLRSRIDTRGASVEGALRSVCLVNLVA